MLTKPKRPRGDETLLEVAHEAQSDAIGMQSRTCLLEVAHEAHHLRDGPRDRQPEESFELTCGDQEGGGGAVVSTTVLSVVVSVYVSIVVSVVASFVALARWGGNGGVREGAKGDSPSACSSVVIRGHYGH